PAWYFRWVYRNPAHHQVRRTILRFCGFRRLRFATFAPVRSASVARRARWLARVAALAAGLPAAAPPGARGAHG
ncbi:MAG: flavodoxin family protein, partial [Gammaproteobacteria bacterium]